MIIYKKGDIFQSDADCYVNPVNTIGVTDKGLIRQFRDKFPINHRQYMAACAKDLIQMGRLFIVHNEAESRQYIINFPTKRHWGDKSEMKWVISGLIDLRQLIDTYHIQSIAIPALGSGYEGLQWKEVKQHIEDILGAIPDVEVEVYEP